MTTLSGNFWVDVYLHICMVYGAFRIGWDVMNLYIKASRDD